MRQVHRLVRTTAVEGFDARTDVHGLEEIIMKSWWLFSFNSDDGAVQGGARRIFKRRHVKVWLVRNSLDADRCCIGY